MKILNIFKDVLKVILPICNEYHHTAKTAIMNMEKMKEKGKKKGTVKKFLRIGSFDDLF